ncbi:phosphodiesterase/alkaline phosphatase D precursor [Aulographum hederae CBS 113979]|uniref:Phosphodiesterase/alkaline phosphatase D n=1 Tax=Aulographum hederae CBS 113979 TaxID=1176131 RepID=A0A6G1HA76_9PEZI|nr:phosphodiesterase/alkaline phosphatase D precursor [Aulographum hederae CBS 113979]
MRGVVVALFAAVASVSAKYTSNLNYRSPSEHHPFLGISIFKVVRRNNPEIRYVAAEDLNFTHGVASGDPHPHSVILWTRCATMYDDNKSNVTVSGTVPLYSHERNEYVKISTAPICVNYKVSTSKSMKHVVSKGTAYTTSDIDFTVKVEAGGLKPFTWYYYQFNVCDSDKKSMVGRTKTAPLPDDKVSSVKLAVYSCSNYPFGFFNAYGNVAKKSSVDYVLHMGDFIYEYAEGAYGWGWSIGRTPQPNVETRTLYDYRKRHASYHADPGSIESLSSYAWIPVWDDHDVGDNVWRDGMADQNNTEASFTEDNIEFGGDFVSFDQRKMNAVRAYFEWMPIRQVEMDDNLRIWRTFRLGTLADIIMLDTRNYDRAITDLYWNTDYIHEISNDASRTMMGSRQENWFYGQLSKSKKRGAAWRLIGSQTVFSRQNYSISYGDENPLDYDAWDGYAANRNRTFEHLYKNNITNNIMLAGDSHLSWVSDLVWLDEHAYDPSSGAGSIGVEFAGTAVSSPCPFGQNITMQDANNYSAWLVEANRELQWQDSYYRGYYELTVGYEEVHAQYFGIPSLVNQLPYEVSLANFSVQSGANRLQRPVAGGTVASGALKFGQTVVGNVSNNTETGEWLVTQLETFGYGQDVPE